MTGVHGELLRGWLRGLVPEARVASLTHWRSVAGHDDARRRDWRQRLGTPDEVIVGSFGNIGPERRLDRVFKALAGLGAARQWRFVVAGKVDPRLGLEELARDTGIAERVSWHSGLADADFTAVMGATDIAVNLRYPPARASSSVLHQLLQLGTPAIISDVVHWRDYPDAVVARVPPGPDGAEHEALVDALRRWIDRKGERAAAGEAAATWAAAHLNSEKMRESYVGAVDAALGVGGDIGPENNRV